MVEYEHAYYNKKLYHISEINKDLHLRYKCPKCNGEMTSATGEKLAHHFRHLTDYDHKGESALHLETKFVFFKRLTDLLENTNLYNLNIDFEKNYQFGFDLVNELKKQDIANRLINYKFNLDIYNELNLIDEKGRTVWSKKNINYNLLENISKISYEKKIDNFIPDISLMDENNNLIRAIEIVHKHEDEEDKIEYYKNNEIDVIYIYVDNDDDYQNYLNNEKELFKIKLVNNSKIYS